MLVLQTGRLGVAARNLLRGRDAEAEIVDAVLNGLMEARGESHWRLRFCCRRRRRSLEVEAGELVRGAKLPAVGSVRINHLVATN